MPKDRSLNYYLGRLEREFPTIYADLRAGKYRSATDALVQVGLKKRSGPFSALRNAWKKASPREQADFLIWIGAPAKPETVVDADRRLTPAASARIQVIMQRRKLEMGAVMHELGFNSRDGSLGNALWQADRVRLAMIAALDTWIDDNRHV